MNADMIRTLYEYNYALHRRVWDCTMRLTDEQFTQDVDYSLGSVRNHWVHLIGVDSRWLARMQGSPVPSAPNYEDFITREATRARWHQVEADMLAYVAGLQDAELSRIVEYNMPHRGGDKRNPLWQILVHVVNHGTDHRAQILPILHRLGAPTLEQDLMIYLWGKES